MQSAFIILETSLFVSRDLLDYSSKTSLYKMLLFVYSCSTIKLAHK